METLGAGLVLTGLALQAGLSLVTAKLAIIGLLIFFTSPTAAHALAKAALARGIQPLLGRRRE
jgi:multicomponent Na+:H+ antiporter subunit G